MHRQQPLAQGQWALWLQGCWRAARHKAAGQLQLAGPRNEVGLHGCSGHRACLGLDRLAAAGALRAAPAALVCGQAGAAEGVACTHEDSIQSRAQPQPLEELARPTALLVEAAPSLMTAQILRWGVAAFRMAAVTRCCC